MRRVETPRLVERIAASASATAPLRRPAARAALWLALSVPFVALIVAAYGPERALFTTDDPRLLVEQIAAAATAILAAFGAFASVVPGSRRIWLWLPLLPLAVWLAALGQGCIEDYARLGAAAFSLRIDTGCFVPMAITGFAPTIVITLMLLRGAPLRPRTTLALAGLAVGGLANVGLQLFHHADISLMVLVWHLGTVALFSVALAAFAPKMLRWNTDAGWTAARP